MKLAQLSPLFLIAGMALLGACKDEKKVHHIHSNLVTIIQPDPSWRECQEIRERSGNYYGYYDSALEEWVYPRTIDRPAFDSALARCRRERAVRLEVCRTCSRISEHSYEQLESMLERVALRHMDARQKGLYILREFDLSTGEALAVMDGGRLSNRVIVKVQTRLGCSRDEAVEIAQSLLLLDE